RGFRAAGSHRSHRRGRPAARRTPLLRFRSDPGLRAAARRRPEGGRRVTNAIAEPVPTTGPAGGPELLMETSRALPIVSITLALRSGAIEDPEGREGL